MKRHYTYKVTLPETGQFYIGVRSFNGDIFQDPYKGSMKHWKVDKNLLEKEIICEYDTREAANEAEIFMLILQLKGNKNPLCMNAHIPTIGFCTAGKKMPYTDEHRKNQSIAQRGKKMPPMDEKTKQAIIKANTGAKRSDKSRKIMSEKAKGNKNGVGNKGPVGMKHTDEVKAKISAAHKGKTVSDETKTKMSVAAKSRSKKTSEQMKKIWKLRKELKNV